MKHLLTLNNIAGYTTERNVWTMLCNLSSSGVDPIKLASLSPIDVVLDDSSFKLSAEPNSRIHSGSFQAPEVSKDNLINEKSAVWTLGALAFFMLMGVEVFEGKGGSTQTKDTVIPRIGSAHGSAELSKLIMSCLNHEPDKRPPLKDIQKLSEKCMVKSEKPKNTSGKVYFRSLVKFWPEEMVPLFLVLFMMLCPVNSKAQTTGGEKDNEMNALVSRCERLRDTKNRNSVTRELRRDEKWTLMDELEVDRNGECSKADKYDTFNLNEIGERIVCANSGVTNAGGRYRDGRDPRYKYSFLEVPVKAKKKVEYKISGREGRQCFAIVPFNKDMPFKTSVIFNKAVFRDREENGVHYIKLDRDLKKTDSFQLIIENLSQSNQSFAIINYNSRTHD